MDSILGYHMNPLTCGVAKFNLLLSRQLEKPNLSVFDPQALQAGEPLLSFKISEFSPEDVERLEQVLDKASWNKSFQLFLHDWGGTAAEERLLQTAETVSVGNSELGHILRAFRADVRELWCPGMLTETQHFASCDLSVFSFGMAHKLRPAYYRKLRQLLDDSGKSYCLYLSTALHEETSFDGHFTDAFRELKRIFGDKVYFLGYLSDAAVFNYLSQTTYFAAFFEKGVRANNTSVHSAMQFGSVVITNLSEHSPAAFTHMGNMIDIQQCDGLPTSADMLRRISSEAERTSTEVFGWKHLVECLSERKATI